MHTCPGHLGAAWRNQSKSLLAIKLFHSSSCRLKVLLKDTSTIMRERRLTFLNLHILTILFAELGRQVLSRGYSNPCHVGGVVQYGVCGAGPL